MNELIIQRIYHPCNERMHIKRADYPLSNEHIFLTLYKGKT